MDLENLKRANDIQCEINALNRASDIITGAYAQISITTVGTDNYVVLKSDGFKRALRDCIDEYIIALLEEAKTL